MNNTHTHTAECFAVNELNETSCIERRDFPMTVCRHTVTFADDTHVHTFTDNDDDAIALALITPSHRDRDRSEILPARVTFRDTDHKLDDLAPSPGMCIDVPNSAIDKRRSD